MRFDYTIYTLDGEDSGTITAHDTPEALIKIGASTDLGADHFDMHRDGWSQDRDNKGNLITLVANPQTNNFVALKPIKEAK